MTMRIGPPNCCGLARETYTQHDDWCERENHRKKQRDAFIASAVAAGFTEAQAEFLLDATKRKADD